MIYIFPGQGSDERLFKHLVLPPGYDTVHISYPVPEKHELPGRYTFQQHFRLNRIIPKRMTKGGARLLQGIVEPDRKHDKETFKDMLKAKDPVYLKRTVDMIINWERIAYSDKIVHIHGDKDHTIPIKNVQYEYLIEEGSHMMMITRAGEINVIIASILKPGRQKSANHK